MKVLTLIVSYNFEPWLRRCLDSVLASRQPTDILVVDNGSTDRTVARLKAEYRQVRLIDNGRNLGFGQANNLGLRLALREGYDHVFLLNQDAWIAPDVIGTLCTLALRHPDYGILSPVHLDGSGRQPDHGFAAYTHWQPALAAGADEVIECPFINAAFWLLPAATLRRIGGFSPLFYHYGEDKDYVNRVHRHGLKVGYSPRVTACHDRARRTPDRQAFLRTERVYHLSEYANPNHSLLRGFLLGPLAAARKALSACPADYLRMACTLLGQTPQVIRTRRVNLRQQPNYLLP